MSDAHASFFAVNQPCDVLGLTLTLDPARGEAVFPVHQPHQRPVVFVDAVDHSDALGLEGLSPGDALMSVGGAPAHYRSLYVKSPAEFITAAATMYIPHVGLQCCYVEGTDANNKQGWTACRTLQLTREQHASLSSLASHLQQHAQSHGFALQTPTRQFRGGSYWKNALLRSRLIRDIPGDEDTKPIPIDLPPVHMQYLGALFHMLKTTAAPVTVNLSADPPTYEPAHAADRLKVEELNEIMSHFQVAHLASFRHELHRLATSHPRAKHPSGIKHTVEQVGKDSFRITP